MVEYVPPPVRRDYEGRPMCGLVHVVPKRGEYVCIGCNKIMDESWKSRLTWQQIRDVDSRKWSA